MAENNAERVIFDECMRPDGFAALIRENRVDCESFDRLIHAVNSLASQFAGESSINRLTIACLFELPWEIENTVTHYSEQSPELGRVVSCMADQLREAIGELLWRGLESHYEDL